MAEKIAGINAVMEAVLGRRKIHRIFIQEGREGKKITELLQIAQRKGLYCQKVEKSRLDKMFTDGNHQGVVAEIDNYEYSSLDGILEHAVIKGEKPFIVMIDGLEDPQNLGAIIRTAECAGVHGIIIPHHHSVEVTASVVRISAGAVEHMRIARETNLVNCIQKLKEKGFWIIGADIEGNQDYFSSKIPEPAVLVIGGENRGLRRLIKENCDLLLRIPMHGSINSLNASIAAGLMMYEMLRQRSCEVQSPNK